MESCVSSLPHRGCLIRDGTIGDRDSDPTELPMRSSLQATILQQLPRFKNSECSIYCKTDKILPLNTSAKG